MADSTEQKTSIRECGHCGNRAPMIIVAKYNDNELMFDNENRITWNEGESYQLLKCQGCGKIELRHNRYSEAFNEEECPTKYETLYPHPPSVPKGCQQNKKRDEEP